MKRKSTKAFNAWFENLEEKYHSTERPTGRTTGFLDLDRKIDGFKSGLYVVAGRPNCGHDVLLQSLFENSLMDDGKTMLVQNMMSDSDYLARVVASLSRVNLANLATGNLDDEDWLRISSTLGILADKEMRRKLVPLSNPKTSIEEIVETAHVHKPSIIFISDFFSITSKVKSDSRYNEMTSVALELKALSIDLNIPIVIGCGVLRGVEGRSDNRPALSDLRDAGAIEDYASHILMTYRSDAYCDHQSFRGLLEVFIVKAPLSEGNIRLTFQKTFSRCDNYSGPPFEHD